MRFAALIVSGLLVSACDFGEEPLNRKVVLDVNGHQMRADEFAQELAFRLKDQDALSAKNPKLIAVMKEKISEEFTVQTLSETWAKENGLVLKAEEIEKEIQKIQKSYPDDSAFQQAILEQGMTFKSWKARVQNTLLQKAVAKRVVEAQHNPGDSDIQAYYQEHRSQFAQAETAQIRQIMVPTESDAKVIETELKKGKRMAELAKKYSTSPEAAQAGMVGWVEKGMTEIFESAFRMKQGQRSPVFKSAFGYHIFEVVGRKPARTKSLAESKDQIKTILMEKNQQTLYLAWLEEQLRKSRVFKDQSFIDGLKVVTRVDPDAEAKKDATKDTDRK